MTNHYYLDNKDSHDKHLRGLRSSIFILYLIKKKGGLYYLFTEEKDGWLILYDS